MDCSPQLQSPLSMGFLMQEYWRGLPFPPSGDLPNPGMEPASPALPANFLPLHHLGSPYLLVKWSEVKLLSRVRLFETPWTVAGQTPPSVGFSRQEYWSGLSFPSPGDLPDPGIEPTSRALQADALTSEPPGNKPLPVSSHCLFTLSPRPWQTLLSVSLICLFCTFHICPLCLASVI